MSVGTPGPGAQAADDSAIARLLRETERSAIRARNGIRYLAGNEWAPLRPTPSEVVWRQGTAELRRYRNPGVRYREPVVMFIGLVSRSYILDLHRQNSLTRALVDAGLDVYLLDWGQPAPADAVNTLETYTLRYLPRALRAALRTSKAERASLLGYCMGGNLALLALAAQRLPVTSLVTMATPVDFTKLPGLAGAFRARDVDPDRLVDWSGNVPAEYLAAFFRARRPTSDIPNFARLWENLWNDEFVESHQAMARWAREHVPFPGAAFRQVTDQWLRHNGFLKGGLVLGGQYLNLRDVDCPTLSLLALRDDLIPPEAARPIASLLGAEEFELLELEAGHAGLTTSRKAATTTIPALKRWLVDHNTPIKE
jgi:poly[(R)-3-hydroxyalkanoate] polymerase subunit PhaC